MTVAQHIQDYLCQSGARYDVYPHGRTENFMHAADVCRISPEQLVKGVVLEDQHSNRLMAVIPAVNRIDLKRLSKLLGRRLHLVPREKLHALFPDCFDNAVPALGQAYQMDVIWDDQIADMDDIYFDEGDHEGFLHMSGSGYTALLKSQPHSSFSERQPLMAS
jgi:Ala-tRNA(Pro) deacylase